MRIISGKFGGRHFTPPKGLKLRPTTERSRESLFNILAHRYDIEGTDVLELFAGTGGIGLEFLSHGAASVTAVEKDGRSAAFVQKCLREIDANSSRVLKMPAEKYVAQSNQSFDFIFLDPPYELPGQEKLVLTLLDKRMIKPGGLMILEHRSKYRFDHLPFFSESRKYGESTFSFFVPEKS